MNRFVALCGITELCRVAAQDKTARLPVAVKSGIKFAALAEPGILRLLPHSDLEKVLQTDYVKMAEMFFDDPPSFDNILKCIGALEAEVNVTGQSF